MKLPERIQIATLKQTVTADVFKQFPIKLAQDEVGICLGMSSAITISTTSIAADVYLQMAMLERQPETGSNLSSIVEGNPDRPWHIWDYCIDFGTDVGKVRFEQNHAFMFPYPLPFVYAPGVFFDWSVGTIVAYVTMYYLKSKVKGDYLSQLMVKQK